MYYFLILFVFYYFLLIISIFFFFIFLLFRNKKKLSIIRFCLTAKSNENPVINYTSSWSTATKHNRNSYKFIKDQSIMASAATRPSQWSYNVLQIIFRRGRTIRHRRRLDKVMECDRI